jgi:hypothetical protein
MTTKKFGREIRGTRVPIEKWEKNARSAGLSAYAIDTLVKMFRHYEQHPFRCNSQVLGWLLGRKPTMFGDFLDRAISDKGMPPLDLQ